MRIKKAFLDEKYLERFGFIKKVLFNDENIVEYRKECEFCDIIIQRCTGEIAICIHGDCDSTDIPNIIFHLIVDGLVEI